LLYHGHALHPHHIQQHPGSPATLDIANGALID